MELTAKWIDGALDDAIAEQLNKLARLIGQARSVANVDDARAHTIPVVDGANLAVVTGLIPGAMQQASHDKLVVSAPVPYRHGDADDLAIDQAVKSVGRGVFERLGHVSAGHDAHAFAAHGLGKTAGGHIAPGQDNLRAGVEQRGANCKGVDLAKRARRKDGRVVANAMVVRHAGRKGAQQKLCLVHLSKIRAHALVGKADGAIEEPNLGILNGSPERIFHQAVRGREDDVVSMFDSRFHGGVEHVRIVAVLKRLGAHNTAKVLIEILTPLIVQAVPARRRTGELMDKGDA